MHGARRRAHRRHGRAGAGAQALGWAQEGGRRAGASGHAGHGRGVRQAGARHWRCAHGLARPRRAAGQRVVHLVHSACFWPGLTQYCS